MCKVGGMVGKLYRNTVFLQFFVIPEVKGRCYMPEICN